MSLPRPILPILFGLPVLLALGACGEETLEERVNRRVREAVSEGLGAELDLDSLQRQLGRVVEGLDSVNVEGLSDVEVVGFRELKPLMPEAIAGLPRTKHFGETQRLLGLEFAQAEAVYEGDGGRRVEAKLIDSGGAGVVVTSLAGFSGWEVDRETETGSERTFELDGHKAYERVEQRRDGRTDASLSVLYGRRFVVLLEGEGVTADELAAGYRAFRLAGLPTGEEDADAEAQ